MTEVTIIDIRTIASPEPGRAGQPATWVIYSLGPTGEPRSLFLPKGNPSEAEIQAAIRDDIARNAAQRGRNFTL